MLKSLLYLLIALISTVPASAAAISTDSIADADSLILAHEYDRAQKLLEVSLAGASDLKEKSEILWRLSRISTMLGENAGTKESARVFYSKAVELASQAIAADKTNPNGYMWHCASIGMECKTHNILSQASKVPAMRDDLEFILDKLKCIGFGEAWQAMSELYYYHPFLSTDAAINYARVAALHENDDNMYLYTCIFLAQMLYERNWSASKRASVFADDAVSFRKPAKNTEKYSWYDGSPELDRKSVWSKTPLASLSDRQEAKAILNHLLARCERSATVDRNGTDFKNLLNLNQEWK